MDRKCPRCNIEVVGLEAMGSSQTAALVQAIGRLNLANPNLWQIVTGENSNFSPTTVSVSVRLELKEAAKVAIARAIEDLVEGCRVSSVYLNNYNSNYGGSQVTISLAMDSIPQEGVPVPPF